MRSLAAGLLVWLAGTASSCGALHEAHIQMAVSGDTASVIAWYRVTGPGDSLRFTAARPAGRIIKDNPAAIRPMTAPVRKAY